ncbi:MAG TPA: VOC family protein [Acidimicrobiia bacterium]|jgi:catechol 2,3-dioxygenase-like lactoylglutathione lyase family enzyme
MTGRAGHIAAIDHVSLPMRNTDAMVRFYRGMGFDVDEQKAVVCVHAGAQMINFHRPDLWRRKEFTLRAPAATPPCGDLCFVWEGSPDDLAELLRVNNVATEEGPVERVGGRRETASSVYVRDPDDNLLEFMIYGGRGAA